MDVGHWQVISWNGPHPCVLTIVDIYHEQKKRRTRNWSHLEVDKKPEQFNLLFEVWRLHHLSPGKLVGMVMLVAAVSEGFFTLRVLESAKCRQMYHTWILLDMTTIWHIS